MGCGFLVSNECEVLYNRDSARRSDKSCGGGWLMSMDFDMGKVGELAEWLKAAVC